MEKIIISKEISNSLQKLKDDGWSKSEMLIHHADQDCIWNVYPSINKLSLDELATILYTPNSYIVEESLEEKTERWNSLLGSMVSFSSSHSQVEMRNMVINFAKDFNIDLDVRKLKQ